MEKEKDYPKKSELEFKQFAFYAPITKCWEQTIEKENGKAVHKFIQMTISGLEEDRDGEKMSEEAINDMILQIKSGKIPFFPDHGRDPVTGDKGVYSWKQMMGVWEDAFREGNHLKAVVRINSSNPDAELFYKYALEGMPLGASIGARPKEDPTYIEMDDEVELTKEKNEEKN